MNSNLVRALVVGVGVGLFSPALAFADDAKPPAAAPKKESKKHKHHKGDANKDNKDKK